MKIRVFVRKAIKIAAGLIVFVFAGIALFLAVLWLDHKSGTTLPEPTGRLRVGRTTTVWHDAAHADTMAPQPGTTRELLAWIWYPAAAQPEGSEASAEYLPAAWRAAFARQVGPLISHFVTRDLAKVRTHSIRDAAVSDQQRSYPVLFMRGGLATIVTDYSSLAEDLASHGYVVVGFDAPYRSMIAVFPDGRVIARAPENNVELAADSQKTELATKLAQAWSADSSFALDQMERLNASDPSGRFTGRLDLARVGAFGHSLGGATALQFCHDDQRCKAGVDVDGLPLGSVVGEGVTQPLLFLLSDHANESDAEGRQAYANIHSIYDRLPPERRLYLVIRGANHYRFSDFGAMLQAPLVVGALHTVGVLKLDGRRQVAITEHYLSTFFDVYLKGAPAETLAEHSQYPEVEYVR